MSEGPTPTRILRIAAGLIDALTISLLLIIPATAASYAAAWFGRSTKAVNNVWWLALACFVFGMLLRDGRGGRSPGKRLFGLRLAVAGGAPCSYGRSMLRNLPLVVPGWNLVEVAMLLFTSPMRRTGDLIARTTVIEE